MPQRHSQDEVLFGGTPGRPLRYHHSTHWTGCCAIFRAKKLEEGTPSPELCRPVLLTILSFINDITIFTMDFSYHHPYSLAPSSKKAIVTFIRSHLRADEILRRGSLHNEY